MQKHGCRHAGMRSPHGWLGRSPKAPPVPPAPCPTRAAQPALLRAGTRHRSTAAPGAAGQQSAEGHGCLRRASAREGLAGSLGIKGEKKKKPKALGNREVTPSCADGAGSRSSGREQGLCSPPHGGGHSALPSSRAQLYAANNPPPSRGTRNGGPARSLPSAREPRGGIASLTAAGPAVLRGASGPSRPASGRGAAGRGGRASGTRRPRSRLRAGREPSTFRRREGKGRECREDGGAQRGGWGHARAAPLLLLLPAGRERPLPGWRRCRPRLSAPRAAERPESVTLREPELHDLSPLPFEREKGRL